MGILSNIEPKEVFQYFEELSMVPRSTFHTKKISDFCVEFAKAHNLEYIQDEMNNVIIKKPGTAGYEDSDPVIIQGHLDMVATKTTDSDHDFENDPLDLFVDGDLIGQRTPLSAVTTVSQSLMLWQFLPAQISRIHRSRLYLQLMKRSVWAVHITSIHPY